MILSNSLFSQNDSETTEVQTLLVDINGDGVVKILGFGDSITFGVGDAYGPGEYIDYAPIPSNSTGYLSRVKSFTGLTTINKGIPGETIANGGRGRYSSTIRGTDADIILLQEGSNDSIFQRDSRTIKLTYQRMINIAESFGKTIIIGTVTPTCCDRIQRDGIIQDYNNEIRDVARKYNIPLADFDLAFETTCSGGISNCDLLNLPEGLHPNSKGYDVMGQVALATLYNIDIFSPTGATDLEIAAGLAPGTIIVKPVSTSGVN